MWTTTDNGEHDPLCSRCLREVAERRHAAIAALRAFGDGVAIALAARDALRSIGVDDEDHASAFAAYSVLAKVAEVCR